METVIQRVLTALVRYGQPEAVLLVGSAAEADTISRDIDLLLLLSSGEIPVEALNLIQEEMSAEACVRHDDVFRLVRTGMPDISIAPMMVFSVVQEIDAFASGGNFAGERRYWAPGGRFPEAFAGDIAFGKALHDACGTLLEMKRLLTPYPVAAQKALLGYCEREISAKLELLEAFPGNELNAAVVRGDLVVAFTRAAYAVSGQYLRGLKRVGLSESTLCPTGKALLDVAKSLASVQAQIPFKKIRTGVTHLRRCHALE